MFSVALRSLITRPVAAWTMALVLSLGGGASAQPPTPAAASAEMDLKPLSVVIADAPEPAGPDSATALKPLAAVVASSADPESQSDRSGELELQSLPEVAASAPVPPDADSSTPRRPLDDVAPATAVPTLAVNPPYPLVPLTTPAVTAVGAVGSKGAAFSLLNPSGERVAWPDVAKGQPTLLLFWPSWCPYSRALQPYIQTIWEDYRDHGVTVLTINIEETRDPVAVMQERNLSFPLLLSGNAVADAYGVRLMPAVLLIDGEGSVVYKMQEKTISPIEAAKQIRNTLNSLLGDEAVALPTEYPKAYDLHLVALQALNLKLAPTPLPQSEWEPWVDAYLATLKPGEVLADSTPVGAITNGKQAIAVAREIWSRKYGVEQTLIQAPYRSYRVNNHWIVLASGDSGAAAQLGEGFIAVMEVDSGRILRVAPQK